MDTKDLFSGHSELYAAYRPTYPEELYQFVLGFVRETNCAWDCGTGNGQVARRLAMNFETVYASDISAQQLQHAYKAPNIFYSVSRAEETHFDNDTFDLITVAQALHWLNIEPFFKQANRVGKRNGIIAVWGYGNIIIEESIDDLISVFYKEIVGPYWDAARRLVEEKYEHVSFPFKKIPSPDFHIKADWSLEHLAGYLESWSATQRYILANNKNPVPAVIDQLSTRWKNGVMPIKFPVFLKIGRI